jgi:hypothetical protein
VAGTTITAAIHVSASVWAREVLFDGKMTTFYSVSPQRSYIDRGTVKYAKSFDLADLGQLITVVKRAHEYIQGLQSAD